MAWTPPGEAFVEDVAVEDVAKPHKAALQFRRATAGEAVFVARVVLDAHADLAGDGLEAEDVDKDEDAGLVLGSRGHRSSVTSHGISKGAIQLPMSEGSIPMREGPTMKA